jgi:isoquinoline 1-oxidoreductase beta subunit
MGGHTRPCPMSRWVRAYTSIDADRRRVGNGPEAGAGETPPNLYQSLLGVQATGNSDAMRRAWQPLRKPGAAARTMLVAAMRWNVDRVVPGAKQRSATCVDGRSAKYGEAPPTPPACLSPKAWCSKTGISAADQRPPNGWTPAKVTDGHLWHRRSAAGRESRLLTQSPVFGGRVKGG